MIVHLKEKPFSAEAKFFAFTLAEVLITLGIIGLVAALTIPTLAKNIQDVQYKSAYKKAYSAISQALINANNDSLIIEPIITSPRPTDYDKNFLAIMSNFKTVKHCISGSDGQNCWDDSGEKYGLNFSTGYPLTSGYSFIDASGIAWSQFSYTSSSVFADTNGFKSPNQWGKDRFVFFLYDINNTITGLPTKVKPPGDNFTNICYNNKCATEQNYFGRSWLTN